MGLFEQAVQPALAAPHPIAAQCQALLHQKMVGAITLDTMIDECLKLGVIQKDEFFYVDKIAVAQQALAKAKEKNGDEGTFHQLNARISYWKDALEGYRYWNRVLHDWAQAKQQP